MVQHLDLQKKRERELFIETLQVRIHFIIEKIWWTGLAPWKFELPFSGRLIYLDSYKTRNIVKQLALSRNSTLHQATF